jgi:tetratricopeptide (TPR) repeat protein
MTGNSFFSGVSLLKFSYFLILIFSIHKAEGQGRLLETLTEEVEKRIQKNEPVAAMLAAQRIVQMFPASPEGYLLRAKVHELAGALESACTDLGLAIAVDSDNPESRFMRGMIAYRISRFDLARADFRKLLDSKNSITNTVFFRQNNFRGTDRIMTMQSGPADQLLHLLGLVEIKAGNYPRAIEILDSAIRLNNTEADMYAHRGLAYEKINEAVRARKDFEYAFSLNPEHSVTLANNASSLMNEGRIPESLESIGRAIRSNPDAPDFYAQRAFMRLKNNEFELAVSDYDSAVHLSPQDGALWFNRGLALEKCGRSADAFESFGLAIIQDERNERAWFMQGALQLKKNEIKNAISSFTIAIGINPEYSAAYHNRAIAYFKSGQNKNACSDIMIAASAGHPDSADLQDRFCR